jgi:signal transduction histidine kinase
MVQRNIRTPLAVIYGHVQLLQRRVHRGRVIDSDDLLRTLDHIQKAVRTIESQLEQLGVEPDRHKKDLGTD